MSDLLIRGMDMPKDGFITVTITSDGRVVGNSQKISGKFEYLQNEDIAIAVPVPPHGRLTDEDALFKQVTMDEHFSVLEAMYVQSLISNAPTIIPVSGGQENE